MIFYHGTSSGRLPSILKRGLLPRGTRGVRGNWRGRLASQKGFTYLSRAFAAYYAANACKNGETPVILQVRVDLVDCYPDEDWVAQCLKLRYKGLRIEDYQAHAEGSLSDFGVVAVRHVPPAQILGHREMPGMELWGALGGDLALSNLAYRTLGDQYRARLLLLFTREEKAWILEALHKAG